MDKIHPYPGRLSNRGGEPTLDPVSQRHRRSSHWAGWPSIDAAIRLRGAVTDSGQSEDFKAIYWNESNDILKIIGSEISNNLKLIEEHLKNRNS